MQSAFRYWRPFLSSSRLVPGPGASPVFRWRRSGVHVSCGGPGGGGEGRHRQPVGAGQSVGGPVDAMVSAEPHPQPHLHLLPPDRLRRISDGQGGGAAVTVRPRSREYRLHPYRWGYTGVFIALHLYLTPSFPSLTCSLFLHHLLPFSFPSCHLPPLYTLPSSSLPLPIYLPFLTFSSCCTSCTPPLILFSFLLPFFAYFILFLIILSPPLLFLSFLPLWPHWKERTDEDGDFRD